MNVANLNKHIMVQSSIFMAETISGDLLFTSRYAMTPWG